MTSPIKALLAAFLLAGGLSMNANEYSLAPQDLTAEQGTTATLSVNMDNGDVTVLSFQCDIYLPDGVSVATNSKGKPLAYLNDDRIDDHIITAAVQSDGAVRFLSYSMSNAPYEGSDGVIFTTPLEVNAAPGTYQITIKNASLTKEDYSEFFCPEVSATLTVTGEGGEDEGGEGEGGDNGEYALTPLDLTAEQGTTETLSVSMDNGDVTVLSFQCDIYLPDGVSVATNSKGKPLAYLNDDRIDDHIITAAVQSDGAVRYLSYSMSNAPYEGSDGVIFTTPLEVNAAPGTYQITIKNASLTKEDYSEFFCPEASATLTVTGGEIAVTDIVLDSASLDLTIGATTQLTATVGPENATDKTVIWTSSNADIATVDANGMVTAVGVGTATITATCGSVSATCAVTVNPIVATSVTINKTATTLLIGSSETLTATVAPTNTTDKTVIWTSSNADVATVDANGNVTAVAVGTATITATCGGVSATCAVTVNPIVAAAVTLDKTEIELLIGTSETIIATVSPDNTTDKTVTWTSSNAEVATVDANGNVTAVAVGTATITAICGDVSATCAVTVNPIVAAAVTLDKTELELLIGSSETLVAMVSPDNTTDKTVAWTSSDADIATVDANGNVTAIGVGTATITATCGDVSAACAVTVNPIVAAAVTLDKAELELLIGESETLVATVSPDNTTDKTVTWASSDAEVATVDANGNVTAVAVGTATITATCGDVSATCTVTVKPIVATAVTLDKTELELLIGESETLVATVSPDNTTDKTVTWTSSNAEVATVDANGTVTAIAVGTATITATCGDVSATCTVTVNPIVAAAVTLDKTEIELLIGESETLVATVSPDNTTDKTVTLISSNADVATVDANGNVTAVAVGTATITATCGDVSATCAVTVNPIVAASVALNKTEIELLIGESETLVATVSPENTTDKTVTWASSDAEVATVDANGNVTAVAVGSATITATCGDVSATCAVTVNPIVATAVTLDKTEIELLIGESETLIATVSPDNTTDKTVTWASSDAEVATVDANGNVTAVAVGTATITATCGDVSATCAVTVKPIVAAAVTLDKAEIELLIGESETLVATVSPENTTDKTVTWASSNADIATVDANGNVTAVAVGTVTITATCGSVSAACAVTVNPIVAAAVTLDKTEIELLIGESETLAATVSPDNTTDKTVTWTSSNVDVANIDANGTVTAVAVGTATITATCGDVSANCEVTVTNISGIETVSDDSFDIRVEGSELVIEGLSDDALVHVFTLDGRLVYSGYERRITLQGGTVYIVAYPGGSRKVAL